MTRVVLATIALAALLGAPALARGGQGEPAKDGGVAWESDYEAAIEKAAKEKKPILVSFTLDGEPANERQWSDTYVDPKFVAQSRKMVCLAGNITDHAPAGQPCPKFPTVTCEQHKAIERKIRAKYLKTDLVISPQHVFCGPTGEELFRKVWEHTKQDLLRAMAMAISGRSTAPPGAEEDDTSRLAAEERARVDRLLREIESNNVETRDGAFTALATSEDARALPAILAKSKVGASNMIRYAAIHALGQKGNYAAIKALLGFLKERETKISIYALNSLMRIELPEPVPEILKLLKTERNDRVRAYALRAAAKCHPGNPEVQKACFDAIKNASAALEPAAMIAVLYLKADPKIVPAAKAKLDSGSSPVRALAALILGKQRDPALCPLLAKMAEEDRSTEVREIAPRALAYCKGEEVAGYEDLGRRFYYDEDLAEVGWGGFFEGGKPRDAGGPPRLRRARD